MFFWDDDSQLAEAGMYTMAVKSGCTCGSSHEAGSLRCGVAGTAGLVWWFPHPAPYQPQERCFRSPAGAAAHAALISGCLLV